MGWLGASFQIGRSALAAYQSAIAVAGQNVANAANPNYTRQTGRLSAMTGGANVSGSAAGGGVSMSALERHIDEALESRLRSSLGSRAGADATAQALGQVETLYDGLSDQSLSSQLTALFSSFSDLQNTPDDTTARNQMLAAADKVIATLHRQRSGLVNQAVDLNQAITQTTAQADQLASQIADLNQQIAEQEGRGAGFSAPLRDQRDGLLRDLSGLMDIDVREQSNGSVNVYVGSEPLVQFNRSRGLTVQTELIDGLEQATVRFTDNNGKVIMHDGSLAAMVSARGDDLSGQVQQLDQLARALIYEVNRVQSTGRGLTGQTTLNGSYAVNDANAALNSADAGLSFPVKNGSFLVHLRDNATGQTTTRLIEVDLDGIGNDTTLNSLAASLNGVQGLAASVTSDGRLRLTPGAGSQVWFSEDSSGAMAALGMNTMLTGTNAADIDVGSAVRANPGLIAASQSGETGDGANAGRAALLSSAGSSLLNGQTLLDFQAGMVGQVATKTAQAKSDYQATDAVYSSLLAQREAISGVSLDEEAINLTKFERAFQGATRYLSVLDTLTTEVLSLVTVA
jgi:flagellar hook-associated protein 1